MLSTPARWYKGALVAATGIVFYAMHVGANAAVLRATTFRIMLYAELFFTCFTGFIGRFIPLCCTPAQNESVARPGNLLPV
jgi:hypothetical protein